MMQKAIIFLVFFLMLAPFASAEDKVYSLGLRYEKGMLVSESIKLFEGKAPDRKIQPEVGYKVEVVSFKGMVLYSFKFSLGPTVVLKVVEEGVFDVEGNPVKPAAQRTKDMEGEVISLIIPYFPDAEHIGVYNPEGKLIVEVDVSKFAEKPSEGKLEEKPGKKEGPFIREYEKEITAVGIIVLLILIVVAYQTLKKKK